MRELFVIFVSSLMISCTDTGLQLGYSDLYPSGNSQRIQENDSVQYDNAEITSLIEKSDLIIMGEVVSSNFLIDAKKRDVAIEKAVREGSYNNGRTEMEIPAGYVRGSVYDIAGEVIFRKDHTELPKNIQVYDPASPFSLHSSLPPLMKRRTYIIFLSRGTEELIDSNLMLQVANTADLIKLNAKDMFAFTMRSPSAIIATNNNDRSVQRIKKLIAKYVRNMKK